jgi:tellurite resistance protein TehA-like permease
MSAWNRLVRLPLEAAADLFPGYFSLVMATGALSIAAQLLGHTWIAQVLLVLNIVAYAVLIGLVLIRLGAHLPRVVRDFGDHARGPGFFTVVAGTFVLGAEIVAVAGATAPARWLWFLGLGLWLAVMYGFFFAVTIQERKPPLASGISGAWLIAAVATQGASVLGTSVASGFGNGAAFVLFVALAAYLLGAMLYLAIITLIFYRFVFINLTAEAMTPTYWINMGAVAISTLAGATLLMHVNEWPFLAELQPFIRGCTLLFWVTATWWIPLLLLLMFWRHFWKRHPIRYEPRFWGMVFPLAMYAIATHELAAAERLGFLAPLAEVFGFLALVAWLLTASGLLRTLGRGIRAALPASAMTERAANRRN